jgi:hypothetical protein
MGPVEIKLAKGKILHTPLIELRTRDIRPGISGAAVLDVERNLVVGLITERWSSGGKIEDDNVAWAINARVVTFDPFNMYLSEKALGKRQLPLPPVLLSPVYRSERYRPEICLNNAPDSLREWVGRAQLLDAISADCIGTDHSIAGLVGMGGIGKSSLARRWIDRLMEQDFESKPDCVFWWGFYDRPNVDEFLEAAVNYLSGGLVDPQ